MATWHEHWTGGGGAPGEYGVTAGLYELYGHCIILIPKIKHLEYYVFHVPVFGEAMMMTD